MNKILQELNNIQQEVVLSDEKKILILAGAGTGKTRVITSKIIHLLENKNISAKNILAVTFTNKAANEMRERVEKSSSDTAELMIRTFHSFGAYILRNEALISGRNRFFQIYDTDDSVKALSGILKKFEAPGNKAKMIHRWICDYKQKMEDYSLMDYKDNSYIEIYEEFNKALQESNCYDFEDLILEPVKLFYKYPEIKTKYQNKFKYILVDEYQDTNKSQFELLKLLSGGDTYITVVGDEDQSIYKFRGADINNILSFEKDFTGAKIFRLEENYRSTNNILNTANELIKNNSERLGKNLFTTTGEGDKVSIMESENEIDEVEKIIHIIEKNNYMYNETAILYRTNNQSRIFEQYFNKNKIPYVIFGSIRFFEREEIKDAVSILRWIVNPKDEVSFKRFANKPPRGIGEKSLEKFLFEAKHHNDIHDALMSIECLKKTSVKTKDGLKELKIIFSDKDKKLSELGMDKLILYYLEMLGLLSYYKKIDAAEGLDKIDNVNEFLKSLEERGTGLDAALLFLEEAALTNPQDEKKSKTNAIKLMTIHNAKGLEFENVFVSGVEKNLFPHLNSLEDDDIEEERRLFYVAITRAKKNLTISYTKRRNIFGMSSLQDASVFIDELPKEYTSRIFSKSNDPFAPEIKYKEGDIVRHKDYGKGRIIVLKKINGKHYTLIDFWDSSEKEFVLEHTLNKLEKVED